jgi:putative DNA primase/helicase
MSAHDDRTPSLSICERGGKVLVKCRAGCSQQEVVAARGARGLWSGRDGQIGIADRFRPERIARRHD